MGAKRDLKSLERRRLRAARLLKRGVAEADVARRCAVSRQSVNRWARQLASGGRAALHIKGLGRPPALDATSRAKLVGLLKKGALAQGYATELWTLERVAEVIERHFGVRYTATHVWRLLRRLGWTPQRPARRALERDEQAIARWKQKRWPVLKKRCKTRARNRVRGRIGSLRAPHARAHLGAEGRDPGPSVPLQLEAALGDRRHYALRFYFRLFPGATRSRHLVEFLAALHQTIGRRLLVIWDGLPAHRSRLVRAFIESLKGAIQLEQLPAYAPELNPVEYIWGYLKQHALANFCAHDLAQLSDVARRKLKSMQRRTTLVAAFWKQAELAL